MTVLEKGVHGRQEFFGRLFCEAWHDINLPELHSQDFV